MNAPFDMDQMAADAQETSARALQLQKADPRLPLISALVIASDLFYAERVAKWLREGTLTFDQAVCRVGSFARLEFIMQAMDDGLVSRERVLEILPEEWPGSDPNDTNPRFLALWQEAWEANRKRYIRDGKALPRNKLLTIYRGQDADAPLGIAWSLSKVVADKFARGAGTREAHRGGIILKRQVPRSKVLAYLTARNEDEVVINPLDATEASC
jgi:hypothetical protein